MAKALIMISGVIIVYGGIPLMVIYTWAHWNDPPRPPPISSIADYCGPIKDCYKDAQGYWCPDKCNTISTERDTGVIEHLVFGGRPVGSLHYPEQPH
jgi:hypothetical protein